ncbi:Myb-related protein 2 [Camellia lanceoleosa]|uniref:Myb-related protein 2 n=1 Tax=Camellia lanceoleosa TaxID=1840588 RepID=A0ACC0GDQ5_9ERIC|nr:Myb-related protein 2 [Camellia lanceoleosa]
MADVSSSPSSRKEHPPSSRGSIPPEGICSAMGNGAEIRTCTFNDAKPRLKWTQDLHEQFIEARNRLGGAASGIALTDATAVTLSAANCDSKSSCNNVEYGAVRSLKRDKSRWPFAFRFDNLDSLSRAKLHAMTMKLNPLFSVSVSSKGKNIPSFVGRVKVVEEKEYFGGSLIETKKEEFPALKRCSSYNADRTTELEVKEMEGVKAKCIPRKPKTSQSSTRKEGNLAKAVYEYGKGNYKEALELLGPDFEANNFKTIVASDEQLDVFNEVCLTMMDAVSRPACFDSIQKSRFLLSLALFYGIVAALAQLSMGSQPASSLGLGSILLDCYAQLWTAVLICLDCHIVL